MCFRLPGCRFIQPSFGLGLRILLSSTSITFPIELSCHLIYFSTLPAVEFSSSAFIVYPELILSFSAFISYYRSHFSSFLALFIQNLSYFYQLFF